MKWLSERAAGLLLYVLLMGNPAAEQQWHSPYGHDHPLTGRIWDSRNSSWIDYRQWMDRLSKSSVVLLGETHDNQDHHRLQGEVVEHLVKSTSADVSVVFEMIPASADTRRLNDWSGAAQLMDIVQQLGPGWPWDQYQPLLQMIAQYRQRIIGANLSRKELQVLFTQNDGWLETDNHRVHIPSQMNATQRWQMGELIREAHCGYVTDDRLPHSVNIQIARDVSFALTLSRERRRGHIAVMITGAGHVRKDFGIPLHLRRLQRVSTSVLFAPVRKGHNELADYIPQAAFRLYDFVYFTANSHVQDPCIEFEKQLRQMKEMQSHAR